MTPTAPTLLEVEGLSFEYHRAGQASPILVGLDFNVREGEFVTILGPSGSGKSTLFYILGCLLRPTRGEVKLREQDLARLGQDEMAHTRNKKIGFIFQQFHLLPGLSVLDNVLLPAQYPSESLASVNEFRPRAVELLNRLGLGAVLHHKPNELSGGQQQRVAICRALLKDVDLILADEPTGNLDSKTAAEVMGLLKELNAAGKTIILITHDREIAKLSSRIVRMKDGQIVEDSLVGPLAPGNSGKKVTLTERRALARSPWFFNLLDLNRYVRIALSTLPLALANLKRNKTKSILTMIGVIVGIASVMAMVTFGQFVKEKVLEGYGQLGVNRLSLSGYANSRRRATEVTSTNFNFFEVPRDILPLKQIFPEITMFSPVMSTWDNSVTFAGKTLTQDIRVLGGSEDLLTINNRQLARGHDLSIYNVEDRHPVCVIASDIESKLFEQRESLGAILFITSDGGRKNFPCKVIGVMANLASNEDWSKPNNQIVVPYTYLQSIMPGWAGRIHNVALQARSGSDIEALSDKLQAYFKLRYGSSGEFYIGKDALVLEQMKKFLNLFTMLLTFVALVSLMIGGIGINNMMLVSVTERLREIGIRKALGATNISIRIQLLLESILLCLLAGLIGVILGFSSYEAIIYMASQFLTKIKFEWVFDPFALSASLISILIVGVASGIVPALKAERIQVIEALRSE